MRKPTLQHFQNRNGFFFNKKIAWDTQELLIKQAKSYKKLDSLSLSCEEYKIKDYFSQMNLEDSRLNFRIRSQCVQTCKTMYSSDWNNIKSSHMCPSHEGSPKLDILSHWSSCSMYSKFMKNRSLSNEQDLLGFYRDVIKYRMQEAE